MSISQTRCRASQGCGNGEEWRTVLLVSFLEKLRPERKKMQTACSIHGLPHRFNARGRRVRRGGSSGGLRFGRGGFNRRRYAMATWIWFGRGEGIEREERERGGRRVRESRGAASWRSYYPSQGSREGGSGAVRAGWPRSVSALLCPRGWASWGQRGRRGRGRGGEGSRAARCRAPLDTGGGAEGGPGRAATGGDTAPLL